VVEDLELTAALEQLLGDLLCRRVESDDCPVAGCLEGCVEVVGRGAHRQRPGRDRGLAEAVSPRHAAMLCLDADGEYRPADPRRY